MAAGKGLRQVAEEAAEKWTLERVCDTCRRVYDQSLENYLYFNHKAEMYSLVVPAYALLMNWDCSDCILEKAHEEKTESLRQD